MNILIINHYAGSVHHGMEYRPFYLSREWVKLGQQVAIVAASASHLRSNPPRIQGDLTEEQIEGIRYLWLKTPEYKGNGLGRVRNIMAFLRQLSRFEDFLLRGCRPDIVIASSTHPFDTLTGCRLARRCGARFVFEVHDLWPLSLIEIYGMSRWHPFILLMQWAEDFAYRNADRVISMLPAADRYMQSHGMAPEKFAYLPNGIVMEEWQAERRPLPPGHGEALARGVREGRFLVGYTGGHAEHNALDTLVDAAHLLQTEPVTFILVGHGRHKEALQERARRFGLTNIQFLPPVPKPCMPALLTSMDALFIGWNRAPIYQFGISPNKLCDYMMAGKPVIHAVEAGNDLVAASGCGLSIPPEDPGAVAEAVLQLARLPAADRAAMGLKGRQYAVAHHDYRRLAQQFLSYVQ
jgi:glycosyltransferase involved in cell wall biosynthesis